MSKNKKVLTIMSLDEGFEKEIKLVFDPQEKEGRAVWLCELEEEEFIDLETLMGITANYSGRSKQENK